MYFSVHNIFFSAQLFSSVKMRFSVHNIFFSAQMFSRRVLPRILDRAVPRRFVNPNPILRTDKAKTDTLSKAQSRKMTPYAVILLINNVA